MRTRSDMSAAPVQRLPPSKRLQPGYREERRKKIEVLVARKMAAQKKSVSDVGPEIRSPLAERSNRDLQKRPEAVKPLEKKMAKLENTRKIQPSVKRDGRTLSQCFLKAQTLKKKETNNENVKPEATPHDPKPPTKPVLGAYRGKIIQSKINSFRKNSENKNMPEQTVPKRQVERPQAPASVLVKTMVRPLANNVKPKRPVIPPVSIKPPTTLIKSRSEPATVRRTTQVLIQQRSIQQKPQPVKPPVKDGAGKKNLLKQSEKIPSRPVKTLPEPMKKPAPQPTATKFSRPKETPEERKARLEEWQKSKGKVMKRPSMATAMPSTSNVLKEEPEIKTEPEEPKEEPRKLYWATMAEEDEQELFTLKVRQIFGGCQKLIDEGCPREEVLLILENQIQAIPEAKKLSGYWECLARLEKRDGQLYKVIAVCEEAVAAGAQPLEELRAILADALEQLKPDPEESVKEEKEEDVKSQELEAEIKSEPVETAVKGRKGRGKVRGVKNEAPKSPTTPEKPSRPESTPDNGGATSSVIRFNICTTPHLEKMKKLQMNEGESSIKSYKFLTPVRRSSRLEGKSHRLPDMLKDHDPCLSGIDQLGDLEETEPCTNAYIFRKNSALHEITARSATKK